MLKYCKIINNNTKQVIVALGSDENYYIARGFTKQEVEKATNGEWYLSGYAPLEPQETKEEQKIRLKQELENKFYSVYPLYKQCNIAIYGTEEERQTFKNFHDDLVGEYDKEIG